MDKTIEKFVKSHNPDVIEYNDNRYLRSRAKDHIAKSNDTELKEFIKANPKPPQTAVITKEMEDPFKTLGIQNKTSVQEFISQHIPLFPLYQSFLYTTSCGSGKTLAGVYAIYKLRAKTLIISTRNAINDQWKSLLEACFPRLLISTRERNVKDADIWIYTPHYLADKMEDIDFKVSLIIYDEIHSLLSDVFYKVIEAPFKLVMSNKWFQLPYFIGLSATLPQEKHKLDLAFGKPWAPKSLITNMPIHVWDYRRNFTEEDRGFMDLSYFPLEDHDCIKYFIAMLSKSKEIVPSKEYKGMVISYTINASVWAALYIHKVWNVNVLIVRAANEQCLFLEKDKGLDEEFDEDITLYDLWKKISKFGTLCELYERMKDAEILCGCLARLKEGFSVENCTWGIVTKFVWTTETRVQILGRIRRFSLDNNLNAHPRKFFVCSGKVPNNLFILSQRLKLPYKDVMKKAKIEYDFKHEEKIFQKENIVLDN